MPASACPSQSDVRGPKLRQLAPRLKLCRAARGVSLADDHFHWLAERVAKALEPSRHGLGQQGRFAPRQEQSDGAVAGVDAGALEDRADAAGKALAEAHGQPPLPGAL